MEDKVKGLLKGEPKRRGVSYAELLGKLADFGLMDSEPNIRNKIGQGTFTAGVSSPMSGSDRGDNSKIGLIATVIVAAVGVALYWAMFYNMGYASGHNEWKAEVEIGHHASDAAKQIERKCGAKTGSDARECITEIVEAERESQRGESDLAAQWKAADWVMWAGVLAGAQLIATAIGLYYVKRTLEATLAAVEDTNEATAEMRVSNEIARDTAQRQLRAYVTCKKATIDFGMNMSGPDKAVVTLLVDNAGQTPAHEFRLGSRSEHCVGDPDKHRLYLRGEEKKHKVSNAVIGPQGTGTHSHEVEMPTGFYHLIRTGRRTITVGIIISYRDVFGRRHLTTHRYHFDHRTKGNDGVFALQISSTGNAAN